MELIKRTLDVADAKGWYLTQNELRYFTEDFVDEATGEVIPAERSETLIAKGVLLSEIDIQTLKDNNVKTVKVSNIPILGCQEKHMNLWETILTVHLKSGKQKKRCYVVTADSPSDAEKFISEYFEVNIDATFKLSKVNVLDYNKVIKMYEKDREEYEKGSKHVKWYRCQIYEAYDDDSESGNAGTRNVLIHATSLEHAIDAIKLVNGRSEYEEIYNTFKMVQEMNIMEVFIPDENVSYYSLNEI
ncbi:hypothetical protein AGMMS49525_08590 [Bacteroidia bacterium]|nr:hypothetical protein AGMMS49525_08590 [Bacteroidia bacterium]